MRRTTWTGYVCSTVFSLLVLNAAPARAQSSSELPAVLGSAHLIEWDLPVPVDFNPGAVVVDTRGEDNNRAWFVTRLGENFEGGGRKVYRFDFGPSLMKNNGYARWTSWELAPDVINNGGVAKLRPSHDRRYAVVRTSTSIQEVDTQACPAGTIDNPSVCAAGLRRWDFPGDPETPPDSVFVSDIAVDDGRRIFTVGRSTNVNFDTGYIQMLMPTRVPFTSSTSAINAPYGTVTRWSDPGVDQCDALDTNSDSTTAAGLSGFCNSGIDFHPQSQGQNLVYVSNQGLNSIDELDVSTGRIRRWTLPADADGNPVVQPRMLKIDANGTIWVVTGSGHLVSLNAKNSSKCWNGLNLITRHRMPKEVLANDGWGIAPDSHVVGYTDANNSKVGMLVPHDSGICVQPSSETAIREDVPATVVTVPTNVISDVTPGTPKTVLRKTTVKHDGVYVEAVINTPAPGSDPTMAPPDSMSPLGITPVKFKGESTFFYAVGMAAGADPSNPFSGSMAKRVGFVRLGIPAQEKFKDPRDDDDADDGVDRDEHPTWHMSEVGDDDADGVPDQYDTPTSRESMTAYGPAPVAPLAASSDYSVSATASALALIATATCDDLTSMIAVDLYNALGALVATSGPLPGIAAVTLPSPGAGSFTVRVRNLGGSAVNITPTVVVRDLLP